MPPTLIGLPTEEVAHELRTIFEQKFQRPPRLFRAPGRVNLIGEHTDYNQGWVMPAAIGFGTWVAIAPRCDRTVRVSSLNVGEEFSFSLDDAASPRQKWTDYVRGVTQVLNTCTPGLAGADIVLWGDVPLGAGLSSSASLEVSLAVALLGIQGIAMPKDELAKLCQRAENEFVGARCGIMDQFISANGKAGNALMLDCRSLEFELVPLSSGISLVVSNTMVKHQLSGGEYNVRRAQCEEGVRLLQQWFPQVRSLRDVAATQLEAHRNEMPDVIYRRCRHVVTENQRVLEFAQALRTGDLNKAGEMMSSSHQSLRDDYEVSCPELNIMVEAAESQPGVVGSRMTGGGFGGCSVSLVQDDAVEAFRMNVANQYQQRTGIAPEIYVTYAAEGASEVSLVG